MALTLRRGAPADAAACGVIDYEAFILVMASADFQGPGFLVPTRNYELFRWCLDQGLRLAIQMTLMTIGLYNDPAGAYLPSVLY